MRCAGTIRKTPARFFAARGFFVGEDREADRLAERAAMNVHPFAPCVRNFFTLPTLPGRVPRPGGRRREPIGRSVHPIGRSVHPIGRSVCPIGQSVHPIGQNVHPIGQNVHPIGQSVQPIERSGKPIERSREPISSSYEKGRGGALRGGSRVRGRGPGIGSVSPRSPRCFNFPRPVPPVRRRARRWRR
jgi:hypothetical protein